MSAVSSSARLTHHIKSTSRARCSSLASTDCSSSLAAVAPSTSARSARSRGSCEPTSRRTALLSSRLAPTRPSSCSRCDLAFQPSLSPLPPLLIPASSPPRSQVIGAAPGSHSDIDWHETWKASPERAAVKEELRRLKAEPRQTEVNTDPSAYKEFAAPLGVQMLEVTRRVAQQYWRTPVYIYSKTALCILVVSLNSSRTVKRAI